MSIIVPCLFLVMVTRFNVVLVHTAEIQVASRSSEPQCKTSTWRKKWPCNLHKHEIWGAVFLVEIPHKLRAAKSRFRI